MDAADKMSLGKGVNKAKIKIHYGNLHEQYWHGQTAHIVEECATPTPAPHGNTKLGQVFFCVFIIYNLHTAPRELHKLATSLIRPAWHLCERVGCDGYCLMHNDVSLSPNPGC